MNKLIYGSGIYEKGKYPCWGEDRATKEYETWASMLKRCAQIEYNLKNNITYVGCSVHPDFIKFQDFAEWCQNQIGFTQPGWHLDKDIIHPGNKVYGPDTCCFVPPSINLLLTYKQSNQGKYPVGVCKNRNKFMARIHIAPDHKYLGAFDTPELAYDAYKTAKLNEIHRQADLWKHNIDIRVYNSLLNWTL